MKKNIIGYKYKFELNLEIDKKITFKENIINDYILI